MRNNTQTVKNPQKGEKKVLPQKGDQIKFKQL